MTDPDEARRLARFRDPPPITIAQALAAAHPVHEISMRLGRVPVRVPLTPHETTFRKIDGFHADVENGGLNQALTNSSGDDFHVVEAFVQAWCSPELADVFADVAGMFPLGEVPVDRDARCALVWKMPGHPERDPLEALCDRYHELTAGADSDAMNAGLIAFATCHQASFVHLATPLIRIDF